MRKRRKPQAKPAKATSSPQAPPVATSLPPVGPFEIFLVGPPGLEEVLANEVRGLGFAQAAEVPGGVQLTGGWPEVWRLNVLCRGATRVLVRIAAFRVIHLAQLDKRARRVDWQAFLPQHVALKVETICRKSRIYHGGAATQRIEAAARDALGPPEGDGAAFSVRVRIEDDLCTISLDTSGEPLHRRGNKVAVGKAPMRETLAALFLRQCGYSGQEPVFDPMCGSGTFILEAAEIAGGLAPGRNRTFAFEQFPTFDGEEWQRLRPPDQPTSRDRAMFFGADRDAGAIGMAVKNAERAGLGAVSRFHHAAVSEATPPLDRPGLVMINPPYGARIGNKKLLFSLYGTLGKVLRARFSGWRVGMVTSEADLARATDLPGLKSGPPVPHGGLKVRLFQAGPLP